MSNPEPPRAQTLTMQPLVNRIVRALLRTPLICRGIGRRLITVYAVGRKTGRRYAIPVAYTRNGEHLLIGSPFAWARNLRSGQPVEIRLLGTRRQADIEAFTDEHAVTDLYTTICRDNRQFAKFNNIRLDTAGNPNPDDLHATWAAGARAFRLTPH